MQQCNTLLLQDLGSGDLVSDLYIVAHVVRVGRMLFSESVKKISSHNYRRPYGVAVFRLAQSVLQGGEGEVRLLKYVTSSIAIL